MSFQSEADDLARRADDLAGEGFDDCDDVARRWLADDAMGSYPECVIALLVAVVTGNDDSEREIVARLRDLFVQGNADLYRRAAQDEIRAASEFANEWPPAGAF